jgi:NADH-quinone oxidoreductase subunit L
LNELSSSSIFYYTAAYSIASVTAFGVLIAISQFNNEMPVDNYKGLAKNNPMMTLALVVSMFSLAGIPPLAGFFSKDQILSEAFAHNKILFALGLLVSLMTAFYMFRLFFLTFHGSFRGTHDQEHHLHESPLNMTLPLIVLAVCAAFAGFVGVPHVIGEGLGLHNLFESYLSPVLGVSSSHIEASVEWMLMGLTTVLIVMVILYARHLFVSKNYVPESDSHMKGSFKKLAYGKFYVDEFYNKVFTQPLDKVSLFLEKGIDIPVVDGMVRGIGKLTQGLASIARKIQTGNTGYYAIAFVFAILLLFIFFI